MGVGDTKEGDEENISSEVKDVDDVIDEDTISLEDGHEFEDFMKDTSNDDEKSITTDDATEQEDEEVEKVVNSLDVDPLNQREDSESINASATKINGPADVFSDEADTDAQQPFAAEIGTTADDDTKVNNELQSHTNPEENMEFQDDFVAMHQNQINKTEDPYNNNLDVAQNSSNDNLLQEKSVDNENIYLELTSGEHLSLPEVPELSFPELPPDNLNVKPAKKHQESSDQNTQQCNNIVNHQAQDIVHEESFFSNSSNKDEEALEEQNSARLQSFETNISTLAAQVDDINNDMSRMSRPDMSFLATSSGVTLQSINVPLPLNVTSSGSRSDTDQLDKEDQFENIIRCLQFPDSGLQNHQMQSSGIDSLGSPISDNPSTTTVYINTAAVNNSTFVDSLSSLNNLDHHQHITSSASMHQEEEESGSMYNFQDSLTSNLDVMFSQSPEQQRNNSVLGESDSRGYIISSASYSSSPSAINTNSMPSLSVMSSSSSIMSSNVGGIASISPLIASGLSESADPDGIMHQQMVLQNSTPKRVRQRLIEFADGTQQIIQYESPIQDVLPNINTQGRIGQQQSPQFIVQGAGTAGQPVQYLAGGSSGQSPQFITGTNNTTSVQLVGNQLISGGQVLQHSDFYKDHSQYLNVDGRIIKGILAYGDDGNQYVIPDKNAGGDLQPFQVVQGSKKPSRALKMVNRVKRQNQQALQQQQIIHQQQLQQRIVSQPQSKSQMARHQMRNIRHEVNQHPHQTIQITIPERERKLSLGPDLLQSVVDMSGLADSIMDSTDINQHTSMRQGDFQRIQLDVSSPRSYMNSVLGETLTPPKKLFATSSRKRQLSITQTTSTVVPMVSSNMAAGIPSNMAACLPSNMAADIPNTPVANGKGKFTILESKDKPLNGVREKNVALSIIPQQVPVQVTETLNIQMPSASDENHDQQNMFPDTTTNDSSLPAYQDTFKDEHKEMLESLQLDDTTSITTSHDNNQDMLSRKDVYEQPTKVSIESKGRTVARVAPFSSVGQQDEPAEPVQQVQPVQQAQSVQTLQPVQQVQSVQPIQPVQPVQPQPEPEVECDLEVITFIQVHSKLADQLRDSSAPRRVSSHKCQNVNHAILGRAGSFMYWWEVHVSRGERKHLYLTFDNPGIKLFFEESAIKDMNTALQYFNKDSLKVNDSLDISLCVSCVSWAEKKAAKLKNSFQDDTITILKDIREIRPKNLVNYSTLESTNHNKVDEYDSDGEASVDDSTAAYASGDDKVVLKKRGRKRGRTDRSPVNVYKKVYWHSREGLEDDLDLEMQKKPRKPRKQLFDLFCEFPGCNKVYKSYVILRSHVLKHHSGIYSSPSASSGTPGSIIQQTPGSEPQTPEPQISPGENQELTQGGQAHQKIQSENQTTTGFEQQTITGFEQYQIQHDDREPAQNLNNETLHLQNNEEKVDNLNSYLQPPGVVNVANLDQNGVPVKKKRGRPRKYPVMEKAIESDYSSVPYQEKRPQKYIKKLKYKKGDIDEDFKPYPLKKKKFKFSSVKESIKEAIFDIERSNDSDYDVIRAKDFVAGTNKFINNKPEQAGVKKKRGRPRKDKHVYNINPNGSYEDIMRAANPETEVNIVSTNNGNEETIKSIADFIAKGNIVVDNSVNNSEYETAGNQQKFNNVYISKEGDFSGQVYFCPEDYSSRENTILYSISEENKTKENSLPERNVIFGKEIVLKEDNKTGENLKDRVVERIKVDEDMIILREDSISRDENEIQKDDSTGENEIPKEDYEHDINIAGEDVKSASNTVADVLNCFESSKIDEDVPPPTPDTLEVDDTNKDNTVPKPFAYLSSDNISVAGITRLPEPTEPIVNSSSHDDNNVENDSNFKNTNKTVVNDDGGKNNDSVEQHLDHDQQQNRNQRSEAPKPCAIVNDNEQSIKQPKSQQEKDESHIINQNDFKETNKPIRSASIDEVFEDIKIDNTAAVNSMHAEVIDEISGTDDAEGEKIIDSFVVVEVPISKKEIKKWSPKYRKKGGRNLAINMVTGTFSPLGNTRSRKKVNGKSPIRGKNESKKSKNQESISIFGSNKIETTDRCESTNPPVKNQTLETPEENNMAATHIRACEIGRKKNKLPRKARKYATANLFPAVKDGSMTAKHAFKQLRLRFEGLTFLGFEEEYRRYFMKIEEESKLVKPLRIMVEKNITTKNDDSQKTADDQNKPNMAGCSYDYSKQDGDDAKQDGDHAKQDGDHARQIGDCTKQDGDHKKQDGNCTKQDGECTKQNGGSAEVYSALSAVEAQLKSVLAGRSKVNRKEKIALKNIDSLIKSFL